MTSTIGSSLSSENDEEYDEEKDRESLDSSANSLEEDRHEYHGHFSVHDDALPEVGVGMVAIEEETVLTLGLLVLELIF